MTRYMLVIASVMWSGLSLGAVKYKCDGEWVDYWPCDSKPAANHPPVESAVPAQAAPEVTQKDLAIDTATYLPANATDDEKMKALEQDIVQARIKLAKTKLEAERHIGGLVHAINNATIATQEQTLSMMEQRYFSMKYGRYPTTSAQDSNTESTLK